MLRKFYSKDFRNPVESLF